MNHITNRVLLCGPCNWAKSNTYTLSGLRHLNRANGVDGWLVHDQIGKCGVAETTFNPASFLLGLLWLNLRQKSSDYSYRRAVQN